MDFTALAPLLGTIQKSMAEANAERKSTVLVGKAGGGAVSVAIRGDLTVDKVQVAPAAALGDATMLEDLIGAAVNDALRQHRDRFGGTPEEQMQKILKKGGGGGGLLGGLFGK